MDTNETAHPLTMDTLDIMDGRILFAMMDRDAEDRDPDTDPDPLYGMAWVDIVEAIDEDAREEALYWENERRLLADARYDEYWR